MKQGTSFPSSFLPSVFSPSPRRHFRSSFFQFLPRYRKVLDSIRHLLPLHDLDVHFTPETWLWFLTRRLLDESWCFAFLSHPSVAQCSLVLLWEGVCPMPRQTGGLCTLCRNVRKSLSSFFVPFGTSLISPLVSKCTPPDPYQPPSSCVSTTLVFEGSEPPHRFHRCLARKHVVH